MKATKKTLSLVLSFALIASTAVSTGAFAENTGAQSNVTARTELRPNGAVPTWTNSDGIWETSFIWSSNTTGIGTSQYTGNTQPEGNYCYYTDGAYLKLTLMDMKTGKSTPFSSVLDGMTLQTTEEKFDDKDAYTGPVDDMAAGKGKDGNPLTSGRQYEDWTGARTDFYTNLNRTDGDNAIFYGVKQTGKTPDNANMVRTVGFAKGESRTVNMTLKLKDGVKAARYELCVTPYQQGNMKAGQPLTFILPTLPPSVFAANNWENPAGSTDKVLVAAKEQPFTFAFATQPGVDLSELQLDIYLDGNTGSDRDYSQSVQVNLLIKGEAFTADALNTALGNIKNDVQKSNTIKLLTAAGAVFDENGQVTDVGKLNQNISYKDGTWTITLDTTQLLGDSNADSAIEFLVEAVAKDAADSNKKYTWGNNNFNDQENLGATMTYCYTITNAAPTTASVSDAINSLGEQPSSEAVANVVKKVNSLTDSKKKTLAAASVRTLESAITAANNHISIEQFTPTQEGDALIPEDAKLTVAPKTIGLLLAAGVTGEEMMPTSAALTTTQQTSTAGDIKFDMQFQKNDNYFITDTLPFPVTVTLTLPESFKPYLTNSNYTCVVKHKDSALSSGDYKFNSNNTVTFTTDSFSPFEVVAIKKDNGGSTGGSSGGSSSSGSSTIPVTPSEPTFVSDTNSALSVNGAYTFKITSKNGKAPVFVVGTPDIFTVQLVQQSGSDYFYKITAIGAAGAQAGVYVNGTKLLVATVKSGNLTFVSDTGSPLSVNNAYTFKITSKNGKAPVFVVGTPGIFTTQLVKHTDNDYFYKITAIGAPGDQAGVYVNGTKLLVATVKTNPSYVLSDTHGNFKVTSGKAYVFKLTANAKPNFQAGTPSAFKVSYVNRIGNNYYFRVTAVGKAGSASGFYIQNQKGPVAVAAVA